MKICSPSIHTKNESQNYMSPRDWPKLQEWVTLVEKQVGEDAGWHHPGGGEPGDTQQNHYPIPRSRP